MSTRYDGSPKPSTHQLSARTRRARRPGVLAATVWQEFQAHVLARESP